MGRRRAWGLSHRSAPRNDKGGHVLAPAHTSFFQHVIAKHALAHVVTPLPSACHRKTQPCNRTRVSVFCMSLRTSAHTGAAIRIPAGMPGKLAAVWANSWRFSDLPKVLLFVLRCRKEYGLSRRFASRNDMQRLAVCLRRKNALQGQLRTRLRIHPAAPPCTRRNAPAFCLSPRPCKRRRVSVFCMSLRTSAHTGAAIRVPAGMAGKLAAVWANSWRFSDLPKVLLFVLCCRKEYGLPRRFASRNDKGGRHILAPHVLATADTLPPSACHCEPVRTLVRQSASPQRSLASW